MTDVLSTKEKLIKDSSTYNKVIDTLLELGAVYNYSAHGVNIEGNTEHVDSLINMLILLMEEEKGVSVVKIRAALELWLDRERRNVIKSITQRFLHPELPKERAQAELRKWVNAVCREGQDLSYHVVLHWIWNVKQRMACKPVKDVMCPALYGASQGGKSTELEKLLKPLGSLYRTMQTNQLSDDRNWGEFASNYVIYLDDMKEVPSRDLAVLKSLLTANTISQRIMRTTTVKSLRVNSCLIASVNHPISEVVKDTTSGARFWELRCRDVLDWNALGEIDHTLIWDAIDVNDAPPLEPVRSKVIALQKEQIRVIPQVEEFTRDIEISPGTQEVRSVDLYGAYRMWCHSCGIKSPYTVQKFGRELKKLKFEDLKRGTKLWKLNKPINMPQESVSIPSEGIAPDYGKSFSSTQRSLQ